MFFPLLLLVASFGFLAMAYLATVVLEGAGLGWLMWAFVIFALLMALATFAWAVSGFRYQLKVSRGDDRVEEIVARQRSDPGYTLNAAVRDLLAMGKKNEAIRLYSQQTGTDPTAARRYVEAIERER